MVIRMSRNSNIMEEEREEEEEEEKKEEEGLGLTLHPRLFILLKKVNQA